MIEYYFLFILGVIYCLIASVEDVRKTEVANWISFSFVFFALAYRAFYAVFIHDYSFFVLGLLGFVIFYLIGNLLYYSKAFGGADVKLLRGIGIILPYGSYRSLFVISLEFIIILFLVAFVYTLVYSIFLTIRNKKKFAKEWRVLFRKYRVLLLLSVILAIVIGGFISYWLGLPLGIIYGFFIVLIVFLYTYLKALDNCMIVLRKPNELMEGDWILKDVKIGRYTVKNTAHGLTLEDIELLKRARKSIFVKQGVPFVPAILIALLVMVFFYLTSGLGWLVQFFAV